MRKTLKLWSQGQFNSILAASHVKRERCCDDCTCSVCTTTFTTHCLQQSSAVNESLNEKMHFTLTDWMLMHKTAKETLCESDFLIAAVKSKSYNETKYLLYLWFLTHGKLCTFYILWGVACTLWIFIWACSFPNMPNQSIIFSLCSGVGLFFCERRCGFVAAGWVFQGCGAELLQRLRENEDTLLWCATKVQSTRLLIPKIILSTVASGTHLKPANYNPHRPNAETNT